MIGAVTSVVQHGESVQVDTIALHALPGLHEASLAHGDEVSPHGDAVMSAVLVVVSLLVVMYYQFVHGDSLGNDVIGHELVQQVVLTGVVLVVLCIRIEVLACNPFLHVDDGDVLDIFA